VVDAAAAPAISLTQGQQDRDRNAEQSTVVRGLAHLGWVTATRLEDLSTSHRRHDGIERRPAAVRTTRAERRAVQVDKLIVVHSQGLEIQAKTYAASKAA
jgi:hypothetical protein